MTQKRILSGVQPTNKLHLGNYLGALKNWVTMQDSGEYECLYCVVDLHAITVQHDPRALKQATREIAAAYIAAGIDPNKSIIFPQSAVAGHSQLQWLLATQTPLGWLNRMTQFKEKAGKKKDQASLGLYSYPVLMAADILLYHATHVPVGEDQKQHLELTRDIAISFNQYYKQEAFTIPDPVIMKTAARIMSLRDGTQKMSKSAESDYTRINLTDDADLIAQKFRKAKTDALPVPSNEAECDGRAEVKNLIAIYAALNEQSAEQVMHEFGGQQFSVLKSALSDVAIAKLAPMTQKMNDLLSDTAQLDQILRDGADKANAIAEKTHKDIADILGFWV